MSAKPGRDRAPMYQRIDCLLHLVKYQLANKELITLFAISVVIDIPLFKQHPDQSLCCEGTQ